MGAGFGCVGLRVVLGLGLGGANFGTGRPVCFPCGLRVQKIPWVVRRIILGDKSAAIKVLSLSSWVASTTLILVVSTV